MTTFAATASLASSNTRLSRFGLGLALRDRQPDGTDIPGTAANTPHRIDIPTALGSLLGIAGKPKRGARIELRNDERGILAHLGSNGIGNLGDFLWGVLDADAGARVGRD